MVFISQSSSGLQSWQRITTLTHALKSLISSSLCGSAIPCSPAEVLAAALTERVVPFMPGSAIARGPRPEWPRVAMNLRRVAGLVLSAWRALSKECLLARHDEQVLEVG